MSIKIAEPKVLEVGDIKEALMEKRQLPMGRKEFDEFAARIMTGAMIPGATERSIKFAIANMITHLGPTESFKEDAYFIHGLRKTAANQVAVSIIEEIQQEFKKERELSKQQETPSIA